MTGEFISKIETIRGQSLEDVKRVRDAKDAEAFRVKYLGRKGLVTLLLRELGSVPSDSRPDIGKRLNLLKGEIEACSRGQLSLHEGARTTASSDVSVDVSLPGRGISRGHAHPVMAVMERVVGIFTRLGFSVAEGPEIETDYYNFEALNHPADHPARDVQDTLYVEGGKLLRTHTSPVQIHVMEKTQPPVAIIAPGAVYRRDSYDASHAPMFHQVEGLMVDHHITFGHLKGVLEFFCREMFGDHAIRFRPSYFPFTEPSAEMDIACVMCEGKGCSACKHSGWMEVMGCGMVDPNVFDAVGYDSKKVSGFAFGMGIDRIAMLSYGIDDIRHFFENDLRFLEQF